eukprot:TRINITY_DN1125_c0_g1_i1.p1 TRINITY_DN1125_c0_g1~~TRINITY_DN1125_c0_g1_i1.p1  ORF type:complete len:414 (+),score=54.66 TRINITY_DN1125_c0_g1_i1:30-1271(+)
MAGTLGATILEQVLSFHCTLPWKNSLVSSRIAGNLISSWRGDISKFSFTSSINRHSLSPLTKLHVAAQTPQWDGKDRGETQRGQGAKQLGIPPRKGTTVPTPSTSKTTESETTKSAPVRNVRFGGGPPAGRTAGNAAPRFSKAARRFFNARFRSPVEPLRNVLQAAGISSRRGSEEMIFAGRVTVNGTVCAVPQTPVNPTKDTIYVDGKSLPRRASAKLYFALHKPKGYICTTSPDCSNTVVDLFEDFFTDWGKKNPGLPKPRLFTVGRLDVATTGLILVTNDGDFAEKVTHPSQGVTKEYVATVNQRATRRQLATIADGAVVDGVKVVPKVVEVAEGDGRDAKCRIRIVVGEGRHHEVRVLVQNSGLEVVALKRVQIGGFRMPRTLASGKYIHLSPSQIDKIFDRSLQNNAK